MLNVLHRVASQVGALDIGYKAGIGDMSNTKLLFLLGAVSVSLVCICVCVYYTVVCDRTLG